MEERGKEEWHSNSSGGVPERPGAGGRQGSPRSLCQCGEALLLFCILQPGPGPKDTAGCVAVTRHI